MKLTYSDLDEMFELANMKEGSLRLDQGEPDFKTPPHIITAVTDALRQGNVKYTSIEGISELREAISRKLAAENGIKVDFDSQILVTAGASEGMFLALETIIEEGDEALIPDPGYVSYERCVRFAGGTPVFYPLKHNRRFELDLEELRRRITPRTKALIINSPGNPLGNVLTREELEGIARLSIENDLIVISDEIYEKIIYDGRQHISVASLSDMANRTITTNSFSKTYAMTGWRLGYVASTMEIVNEMKKLHAAALICADWVAQCAGLAALTGPQDCISEMVKQYEDRRKLMVDGLNQIKGLTCDMPEGAFYAFPGFGRKGVSSREFAHRLLREENVAISPGVGFGERGEGHVRISLTASLEDIAEGILKIRHLAETAY
jgi:aspartate/methionine/tyrosine aminotransferase